MRAGKAPVDRRGLGVAIVLVVGFGAAAFSQAKLQTVEREHTLALAEEAHRYVQTVSDRAHRGSILAADGRPLAKDEDAYDLTVDFTKCPHSPAFWLDVSDASGVSATELQEGAASGAKTRVWSGAVASSERDRLNETCRDWRADGVSASWSGRRDYPLGDSASSLVGVTRPNGLSIGPDDRRFRPLVAKRGMPEGGVFVMDLETGLEAGRDDDLRGTDGEAKGLTDRHGQFMAARGATVVRVRRDGRDVRLTIVPELQVAATRAVRRQVEANKAQSGVALVMDPKTGDLLAMANWPQPKPYRPDGTENELGASGGSNPCYMSVLEPGSMFKILTLAKCLDVRPDVAKSTLFCSGQWKPTPKAHFIHCDKHEVHGLEDDRKAIAESCNIAAGHWALAIGHDRFMEFLDEAGLKHKSKLGLPGESASLFPGEDGAPLIQTAVVGFGQSINCTPVQLIGAFNAIGNGGVRVEPRVVSRIGADEVPREEGRRLFSEAAAAETMAAMEDVFGPKGTGKKLMIPGYRLAGKTGTAQKKGRKQSGHVSNFIGFLPAQNPRFTILVMVNEPKVLFYGADVAGKAWREIALDAIRMAHLAPTEPIVVKSPQ